jgi:hypothetical protein
MLLAGLHLDGRAEGGGDLREFVVKAFGIGAADAHARSPRQRRNLVLQAGLRAALLGKARRDDDGIGDAGRRAFRERRQHRVGRNDDKCEIDRRSDGGDRRKAAKARDLGIARIDRIEVPGIAVHAQKIEEQAPDLGALGRGPDNGDRLRRKEAMKRMRRRHRRFPPGDEFLPRA